MGFLYGAVNNSGIRMKIDALEWRIMGTPHNSAVRGEIADTVLMPGDPLRAKYIAEKYLENVNCFNQVRGMLGFTGIYNGKRVSVMGSGMGMPSIGIYSYELYTVYDVSSIIRIGTAGGYADSLKVRDLILAMGASTNSNYAAEYNLSGTFAPLADYGLLMRAVEAAKSRNLRFQVGNILSSDIFYHADETVPQRWKNMGVLGVEMETAALYLNAAYLGKKALGIFTVSDHIFTGEELTAAEREESLDDMIGVALEIA